MGVAEGSTTYFVSRHHEHPPATLEELLKASAKRDSTAQETGKTDLIRERGPNADDGDSDSDYQCREDEESDDDFVDSEPEVDEWRLHAAEPQEGLYLHEMRRQRGRIDEKEDQWVRGYIQAQRVWKARTGHSIDEFHIPGSIIRRMKKSHSIKRERTRQSLERDQQEEEEETNSDAFVGVTRLEMLLLLVAIVFVCLSLGVQLHAFVTSDTLPTYM